jgi:hypothetical protein
VFYLPYFYALFFHVSDSASSQGIKAEIALPTDDDVPKKENITWSEGSPYKEPTYIEFRYGYRIQDRTETDVKFMGRIFFLSLDGQIS